MPFGGLTPLSLPKLLRDGDRMEIPDNQACSDEMLVHIYSHTNIHVLKWLDLSRHRYKMIMTQCWLADPDDRPTFSELQSQISSALTTMAGYMEFSEFASVGSLDVINDDS